jgi:hypothetical protein
VVLVHRYFYYGWVDGDPPLIHAGIAKFVKQYKIIRFAYNYDGGSQGIFNQEVVMTCDKCSSGSKGFCPVTLGLAVGLTCALSILFCTAWVMWFGLPAFMDGQMTMKIADNWSDAGMMAVWALLKGFVGGFVFAMIYNLINCCKSKCCGTKCCGQCSCCVKK